MPDSTQHPAVRVRQGVTRRELLGGCLAAGVAFGCPTVLAACGDDRAADRPAGAVQGGSLRAGIAAGSANDTTDAHRAVTQPDACFHLQVYDSLLAFDREFRLVPALAEEVDGSSDARTWTVRLKSGLRFHDGSPVTSDDVVFSFNRIIDPRDPKNGATSLAVLRPSGIVKVDDLTVRFELDAPVSIFPELLADFHNAIVPVGYGPRSPVGTGPFRARDFLPGDRMTFVSNEEYWGEGPFVDDLTVIQYADATARVNALLSGQVDIVDEVPSAQAGALSDTPGLRVLTSRAGSWRPLTMRTDRAPFADERVRSAFRLLVDRGQMVELAYAGAGWLGNDMYAPYDPGYPADIPQRGQDLERASALLKQAGYEDLQVELTVSTAVGVGAVEMAQVFAEQAKGAGVTVRIRKVDGSVFYGEDYLSWTFAQDFWTTRNYLAQASLGSLPSSPWNGTHWRDAEWQAIVEEAFATLDDQRRNELISAASAIEYERGGYIIWAFDVLTDAYSDVLRGVRPDVRGMSAMGFRYQDVTCART